MLRRKKVYILKSVTMRSDAIHQHGNVVVWRSIGSPGERIDVGKKHGEIGTETFDEVEFTRVGESGETANQGVNSVENLLLLHAQEFFVGEVEGHTCVNAKR
ncbi:receptor-type tyrosine-protein phosphatase S-like [Sesbania bispinosa]|nr:receptor-type tyrosine-protein phosphatase S-like [Sesbania bispinosa]